jgi:putative endonuclease
MAIDQRRRALRVGRWAELAAVWLLRLKGYRVLARNWRSPVGEIDIVARRGTTLAAIEVKSRANATAAADAVSARQRRRIERAVQAFVQRELRDTNLMLRFDVVLVVPRRWPRHIIDAWRP